MPFALVAIGLIMVITGVRNTYAALGAQLKADFTGDRNFTYWVASIGIVGSVGYVDKLRPVANLFLVLILLAFVIANQKNNGLFAKFQAALAQGPTPTPTQAPPTIPAGQSTSGASTNAQTALASSATSAIASAAADAALAVII